MQARQNLITAILAMAVLLYALNGCIASKKDVAAIKANQAQLRIQNDSTHFALARIDSLIASNTQANLELRNDVSASMDDLRLQLTQLLENYNSLMTEISRLRSQRVQNKVADSASAEFTCRQSFDDAVTLVREKKFDDAIAAFHMYVVTCSTQVNVGEAHYWMGECLYSQMKFSDAIPEFELLQKDYPKSTKVPQSMYKIARCNQEMDKKTEAKKRFQEIIDKFPETLEAKQSKERLKELK